MVKLLTENIKDEVFDVFENAENEILIISPFIGLQITKEIIKLTNEKHLKVTLITRFNRADFFSKVSSLEALKLLKEKNTKLLAVKALHTKLYIIDNDSMILGSSNFTNGGFINNIELNVLFQNENSDCSEIINTGIAYFNELKTCIPKEFEITKEQIEKEIEIFTNNKFQQGSKFDSRTDFGYEISHPNDAFIRKDIIESCFTEEISKNCSAWIKFEGYSDERRKKGDSVIN